ncbi:hypothetical protein E2C01_033520 [Portunus trituberculatus]|uniref:Uncharacterized protein n=1 Tax=Portunus trituberculatus TaxID=210409 RepID=A0A5B7F351_PORTR|nr:hypothetical protein [Portunus trituberculatus]
MFMVTCISSLIDIAHAGRKERMGRAAKEVALERKFTKINQLRTSWPSGGLVPQVVRAILLTRSGEAPRLQLVGGDGAAAAQ